MQLVDRRPHLDADALVRRFVPPRRFGDVRFASYEPDPEHPSQAAARDDLVTFATGLTNQRAGRSWLRRRRVEGARRARYLDGGFGVGKTHLLASLWHEAPGPKAYVTFGDLTAFVGFAGMTGAVDALGGSSLICIDEFELDDIANTLMVVSFLRGVMDGATTHLAVTSNTLPERLGEQRFSAADFRREIAAIAAYFDELRIDGPDFRTGHAALPLHRHDPTGTTVTHDDFDELAAHLGTVHPVQYGAMLDGLDGVVVDGMHPVRDQDVALLLVQFVDKLYDARIPVRFEGCAIDELFDAAYRSGGYRKKYGRAESRLQAMLAESEGLL